MNNLSEVKGFWIPYKIPPTPTINNNDVYSLTCSNGADGSKNPSQFLGWRPTIPTPPNDSNLYVLTAQNGVLSWTATEDCP